MYMPGSGTISTTPIYIVCMCVCVCVFTGWVDIRRVFCNPMEMKKKKKMESKNFGGYLCDTLRKFTSLLNVTHSLLIMVVKK